VVGPEAGALVGAFVLTPFGTNVGLFVGIFIKFGAIVGILVVGGIDAG
jgi:hypothetical protein